jgi:hypothetical protein
MAMIIELSGWTKAGVFKKRVQPALDRHADSDWWIVKFLVEVARRESSFKFNALNKKGGDDGYWQLLPMSRDSQYKRSWKWHPDGKPTPWPDRRSHDVSVTPTMQAEYVASYFIGQTGVLGTFVDFSPESPVKRENAPSVWNSKITKVKARLLLNNLPDDSRSIFFVMMNCAWSKGANGDWSDELIRRSVGLVRAIIDNTTYWDGKAAVK